ncbi:DUF488 domain-containing protein [Streptosporangium sp. CA-135522]|uniref:DUF488 domain-containing protein n=1 Tax=Streptosporangium sp. CA-135522 TaxID=3240072 RepID=UPI003D89C998
MGDSGNIGNTRNIGNIVIRRVYEAEPAEGAVFLVDGIWPRGVRKQDLRMEGWVRDLAPSPELRRWFGHRPERFEEFRLRYRRELDGKPDAVRPLLDAVRRGPVTLLYAARDTEHNNAVVLRDYLRSRLTTPAGT